MRLSLVIRDLQDPDHERRKLYNREVEDIEVLLPEGAWISGIMTGGVSLYVARSCLSLEDNSFHSELREVVIDAPEHWHMKSNRHVETWWSEVDPELCANYHELLLQAGWTVYGS